MSDPTKESTIPVEKIAGVIVKYNKDNAIVDVLGVSNSPEHAYIISQELQNNDATEGVYYDIKTVKVYPEEAI